VLIQSRHLVNPNIVGKWTTFRFHMAVLFGVLCKSNWTLEERPSSKINVQIAESRSPGYMNTLAQGENNCYFGTGGGFHNGQCDDQRNRPVRRYIGISWVLWQTCWRFLIGPLPWLGPGGGTASPIAIITLYQYNYVHNVLGSWLVCCFTK
jgi:hypothetical protein